MVHPPGIEPGFPTSQAGVLSVGLWVPEEIFYHAEDMLIKRGLDGKTDSSSYELSELGDLKFFTTVIVVRPSFLFEFFSVNPPSTERPTSLLERRMTPALGPDGEDADATTHGFRL